MAQTKATTQRYNGGGSIYASSGYKGVSRRGTKWGWQYNSSQGYFSKGGFDSAEEAAYAYDQFLTTQAGPQADTNQALGLLKPKDVAAVREKLEAREKPQRKRSRAVGKTGFKGVSPAKSKSKPFSANISIKGKIVYIGSFETAELAARAYDSYALRYIGTDAETNVSLGLLPPPEEKRFIPTIVKRSINIPEISSVSVSESATVPLSNNSDDREPETTYQALTPEQERERQIEAARIMAEREKEDQEQEAEEKTEHSILKAPVLTEAANEPVKHPEVSKEKTALPPIAPASPPEPMLSPVHAMDGEHIPAKEVADPASLRERAAALLQQAQEAERRETMKHVTEIVNGLAVAVKGYQQAVSDLVDYGAELESQLTKLQNLLSGK